MSVLDIIGLGLLYERVADLDCSHEEKPSTGLLASDPTHEKTLNEIKAIDPTVAQWAGVGHRRTSSTTGKITRVQGS